MEGGVDGTGDVMSDGPDNVGGNMEKLTARNARGEGGRLLWAIAVTFVVVVLAGLVVEIVNHTGIITGLGFDEQIARAIADTGVFAVTAVSLCEFWRR